MLGEGEFDKRVGKDGIEVWVTMMGPYLNMNTAFIDRSSGRVAIVDPFDASEWSSALSEEASAPRTSSTRTPTETTLQDTQA